MRILLLSRKLRRTFGLFATLGVIAVGCGGRSGGSDLLGDRLDAGAPGLGDDDVDDSPDGPPGLGANAGSQSRAGAGSGGRPAVSVGGAATTAGKPSGGKANGSGGKPSGSAGAAGEESAGAGGVGVAELVDRCDELCARTNEATCQNANSVQECTVGCRVLVQQPKCAEDVQNFFDCADARDVSCDANGGTTVVGCEPAYLAALACIAKQLDDPSLEPPCASYCMSVSSAECSADLPQAECTRDCKALGAAVPTCTSLWEGYLACSEGKRFNCGDNGQAVAEGCIGKAALFFGCVLSAAGQ